MDVNRSLLALLAWFASAANQAVEKVTLNALQILDAVGLSQIGTELPPGFILLKNSRAQFFDCLVIV
jgi:hypothetical protein